MLFLKRLFGLQEKEDFLYRLNDPSSNLFLNFKKPRLPKDSPSYMVKGFKGDCTVIEEEAFQAGNVHWTIAFSMLNASNITEKQITRWTAVSQLTVQPRAGKMFNAYYDRYYLNFFYEDDVVNNKLFYTADSNDVVSHELGHAILDTLRPDLWGLQSVEVQAFHEAFADINALLTNISITPMAEMAINETGGDLTKTNIISRLAEEMGQTLYRIKYKTNPPANFTLRDCMNNFSYVQPEKLPTIANGQELCGEPHNFSRVFTGAWYSALISCYELEKTKMDAVKALQTAAINLGRILYRSIKNTPVTATFFSNVLKSMITFDSANGMGYGPIIKKAFLERNMTPNGNFKINLDKLPESMKSLKENSFVPNVEHARIIDLKQTKNPLADLHVQIPFVYRNFVSHDENNHQIKKAIDSADYHLQVIHDNEKFGFGPSVGFHKDEFSIIDEKLVRNFYR